MDSSFLLFLIFTKKFYTRESLMQNLNKYVIFKRDIDTVIIDNYYYKTVKRSVIKWQNQLNY